MYVQGRRQGGSAEPLLSLKIQIFATTQLASFPGSPHVVSRVPDSLVLTLVHLAQNEEVKKLKYIRSFFFLKDQLQPVKMLSFLQQLVV